MNVEAMRIIGACLSTTVVLLVILSLGYQWDHLTPEIRAKGMWAGAVVVVIDYGLLYALTNKLPLNTAIYLMLPVLAVGIGIYIFFFIKHFKEGDRR